MPEQETDTDLSGFHAIRKPGAHLEEDVVAEEEALEAGHQPLERFVVGEQPHHHRIALEDAHHAPMVDGDVDQPGDEHLATLRPVSLGFGLVEHRFQAGQIGLGGRDDDLVLGLELVVDSAFRDTERVGDHPIGRRTDAVLGEQRRRRVQDPQLRRAARYRAQPRGPRSLGRHRVRVYERLGR